MYSNFIIRIVVFLESPVVTSLDFTFGNGTPLTLSCSSINSPPTEVLWERDNETLSLNFKPGGYQMTQVVVNHVTSAYVSTLTIDDVLDDVVGEYSCAITNSIGMSNYYSATFKGMVNFSVLTIFCHKIK